MDIIERIQQIINKEGLNVSSFAKRLGVVDQSIRGIVVQKRNKPGYEIIYKIVQTFDWVNAEWLITGKGEMEKTDSGQNQSNPSLSELVQYLREKDMKIEQLIEEKTELKIKFEIAKDFNVKNYDFKKGDRGNLLTPMKRVNVTHKRKEKNP